MKTPPWKVSAYATEADATDAAALGPVPLGAPRHGVWVDYSVLPDTPYAWEFSRNAI